MKINVTADDIKNGKRREACDCPIALAIERACGVRGNVSRYDIYVLGKRYDPCPAAVEFINEFDSGDTPAPFSFELGEEKKS